MPKCNASKCIMCGGGENKEDLPKCTFYHDRPMITKIDCSDLSVSKFHLQILNTKHNRNLIYSLTKYEGDIEFNKNEVEECIKIIVTHNLKYHVCARLFKSEYGVGVQAIRNIPKKTYIFDNTLGSCIQYHPVSFTEKEVEDAAGPTVSAYIKDFYLSEKRQNNGDTILSLPINVLGPNTMDISFFLNHSDTPNLGIKNNKKECDMTVYYSLRDIKINEELTIDYNKFDLSEKVINKFMPFLLPKQKTQKRRISNSTSSNTKTSNDSTDFTTSSKTETSSTPKNLKNSKK